MAVKIVLGAGRMGRSWTLCLEHPYLPSPRPGCGQNTKLCVPHLSEKWGCQHLRWEPGWSALMSWDRRIYTLLSVYFSKPCSFFFTSNMSVFSTEQAMHVLWLTVYVITESLLYHLQPEQYQPTRILKASGVLPPFGQHCPSSCPHPQTGETPNLCSW